MNDPRSRREVLALAGITTAALAGCVGGDDSGANGETDDGNEMDGENGMDDGEGSAGGGTSDGDGSMERPDWQTAELEDVTTGETFTISGFDRPVVLHTFATWCPKCRSQQENIDAYLQEAGGAAVAVDLTIDENDDPETLRQHAESNGFGWRFGVSPSSVTGDLVEEFGREMASAPQSPVLVVCPDGATRAIDKGAGPDRLADEIERLCG